jgi:hypothetical protein
MERKPPSPDQVLTVARYLSAAYIAYEHGAGMDYTRKQYAHMPIGKFWLQMAELAIEAMTTAPERARIQAPPNRRIQ